MRGARIYRRLGGVAVLQTLRKGEEAWTSAASPSEVQEYSPIF